MRTSWVVRLALAGAALVPGAPLGAQENRVSPVAFEAAYTLDGWSNLSGGIARGIRVLDNLGITLSVDLGSLVGWKDATLFMSGLGNQGRSPSELIGDAQTVSNIDAPNSWRLYEAWVEQSFGQGAVSLRVGLYDLNSEFDAIRPAALFINSSHGIGPEFSQTGPNGPSVFPITSLALRARTEITRQISVQVAVLDGVPGDPEDPTGTRISLGREDGALLVLEGGWALGGENTWLPLGGRVALGAYYYTRDFDPVTGTDGSEAPEPCSGSQGGYLLVEGGLYREAGSEDQGISVFLRAGLADSRVNQFGSYLGGGVVYSGLLPGRERDRLGLAVAAAINGEEYRDLMRREETPADWAEVALELTYLIEIAGGFSLQPDIQYILNPGTDSALAHAFAVGIRSNLSF